MSAANQRKFVIKPFKQHQNMDKTKAQQTWDELNQAIDEIFRKNASNLSFEQLYRNAYNLVLHKHADLLYNGVQQAVQGHLDAIAKDVAATSDDQLLDKISTCWLEHQVNMNMVRDILMYMDRTHVPQHNKTKVYDLGLQTFRDTIARHAQVRDRLRNLLLENIHNERMGQLVDRSLMKTTLSMLVDLGIEGTAVYEEDFESGFLETTQHFYQTESQAYIAQNTCPDYMRKAEARLMEEANRVAHYLNASTEPKLRQIVERELVAKHATTLVEMEGSGCKSMLRDDKIDDLKRMYSLFSRVPATLDELRQAMAEYVKASGRELVSDQERLKEPVKFVKGLLEMRDKFDRIVTEAFGGETAAKKKLQEAFEDFINKDTRCANFLALYVDDLLKSGLKGLTESDADEQLAKVIVIFKYLQDKDVFENFYKQHLSRRLLSNRSVSDDLERSMIVKLKSECGYQFTSKLEGMFNDMKLSKDNMEECRRERLNQVGGIELEVQMLTMGYWPMSSVPPCNLPPEVSACCQAFESFYLRKHQGRKVTWQTSMGGADIKANFGGKRHELNVSTYQMCILMLFNKTDTLSLEEIAQATLIPAQELKRQIMSLCTPKHRILKKASKGRGIAEQDSFTFNVEFTSKLKRIKVPLVSMKDASQEELAAPENAVPAPVEEDRRHYVEAAIVRIMKTRKTLPHHDLVAEVSKQLSSRFNPAPAFIKLRIESLIEREYLERDRTDRRVYKYLA